MIAQHQLSINFLKLQGISPSRADLSRALGVVALLHIAIVLLFLFGLPSFSFKKKADLTIEFYAPPPIAASADSPTNVAPPPPAPPKPIERRPTPKPPTQESKPVLAAPPQPKPLPKEEFIVAPQPETPVIQSVPAQPPQPRASAANLPKGAEIAATANADYKAAYLKNPKPPYPAVAVRMRAEGRVILLAEVLPDGRAGKVELERSSGYPLLDKSALETVQTWRFTPARKDGVITTQVVRIPIDFQLKKLR